MSILRVNAFSETIPKLILESMPKPWHVELAKEVTRNFPIQYSLNSFQL